MNGEQLVTDLSRLPERAKRELIRGENARAEFAIHAQRRLAEAMGAMGPTRHIEGIGRKVATIHPELAARIRVKYGVRCLHDPEFLDRLVKENPFLKAPCVPARLTVRVNGLRDQQTEVTKRKEEFQNGSGHGGAGDPRTPPVCHSEDPGLVLSFSRRQRSGHETPARSEENAHAEALA